MSTEYQTLPMICPKCHSENTVPIFEFLDLSESSKRTRNMVLSSKIFRFECEECGRKELISYPMNCFDEETGSVITVLDADNKEEDYRRTYEVYQSLSFGDSNTYRIVDSCQELSEKLRMFNDRLDDRIVELIKFSAVDHFIDNPQDILKVKCIYKELKEGKLFFMASYKGEKFEFVTPTKTYATVEQSFQRVRDSKLRDGYMINNRWADRVIQYLTVVEDYDEDDEDLSDDIY